MRLSVSGPHDILFWSICARGEVDITQASGA